MAENFAHSAKRMRDSSKMLHDSQNFHNSCYLAGYVVECYLKIFTTLSIGLHSAKYYSHNISNLNVELLYLISSSTSISVYRNYVIDASVECGEIIQHWKPGNRYLENNLTWDEAKSIEFQSEMEKCFTQVTRMSVDNLIF